MQELTYITAAYSISGLLLLALTLSTWVRARRIRQLTSTDEA